MTVDYDTQIGARIAQARKSMGLTQADLAKLMGLTRSSIANIEAGRQRVLAATLLALAEHVGCDPRWLLTGDSYAPPQRRPAHMSQADRHQVQRGMSALKTVAEVLERLADGAS